MTDDVRPTDTATEAAVLSILSARTGRALNSVAHHFLPATLLNSDGRINERKVDALAEALNSARIDSPTPLQKRKASTRWLKTTRSRPQGDRENAPAQTDTYRR